MKGMLMPVVIKKGNQKFYTGGHLVPLLTTPIIDKLYLTLDIPVHQQDQIISNLKKLAEAGYGIEIVKPAYTHNLKISQNFPDYEGEGIIQCAPTYTSKPDAVKKSYRYFRLGMTPSRIDLSNMKKILDQLLPDGYTGLLENGKVNQIDFTVDIKHIKVAELIASYPKLRVERHYGMGIAKQTKRLGNNNKIVTLYDKKLQTNKYKKTHAATDTITLPGYELTRLELRIKDTKKRLDEILQLPNPFKPLSLIAFPGSMSPKNYDPLWLLFLSVCEDRGVKSALEHFNSSDKKAYALRLQQEGKKEWWQPDLVWEGIKKAITALYNVKGYTPLLQPIAWSDHQQIQ